MISKQEIVAFSISPLAVKWLVGTVGIAALPIILRFMVWGITPSPYLPGFSFISITDFFLFSLIIYLSVLMEAKHIKCLGEEKNTISYVCIFLIILVSIFLTFAFINDAKGIMRHWVLLGASLFMALFSFIVGFCFFYFFSVRLAESNKEELS
ncbi:hypothetical protein [Acinetobacter johnsonii]|uniref:hypothetical protein n=1 Tax=Acinetobacter johnsonii TaxID=40214 RepID=UPI003015F65E